MSAHWDRKQKISFYFGNAARDLRDVFPADEAELSLNPSGEAVHTPTGSAGIDQLAQLEHLKSIHRLVDQASLHMQQIADTQRQLSFLLSDLKRMI